MKINMFGFLKNLWRKPAPAPAPWAEMPSPAQEPCPDAPQPAAEFAHNRFPRANLVSQQQYHPNSSKGIEMPLQRILAELPLELQPRVLQPEVGGMTVSIPLEKILAQLSRGSVKISFGELRHAAPGVFSLENDRDRVLVPLPLSEILPRLNPALITRRRAQRQVSVPEDISSPFDVNGRGLIFGITPAKSDGAAAPSARMIAPAAPPPAPPITEPEPPARATIPFVPKPAAPSAVPAPAPAPAAIAPRQSNGNGHPAPATAASSHAPRDFNAPPSRASLPLALAPALAGEPAPLLVGLTTLAESWPEAVRKEIVLLNLVDAKVALPSDKVEQALKLGRISFSWKTLRSWLKSASPLTASPHDSMVLELPLKVVAPLFLARQHDPAKAHHKVAIDGEIPDLFFGFPQSESGNAAVATPASPPTPADTNYYVWNDSSDVVCERDLQERRPSAGTKFIAKYATPNEIVSRAASLDGVAGALIALPDGLMVANQLPADLNGDTLAAFLPQIFGKVSACTKELRMGELNNLNFTVGNVPWKIFRVNAIFFAAFGRVGQPLPTSQLAALAAELDHKPK
jgi:predicted regulator of Ras-like GTPase activity (Roadblock/LC7/MglB family)